jgi:hypothetical protein
MRSTTSPHPEWALAHKTKGTELRRINGHYYLYKVSSKWCPEKKRARKITGALLGSITEAGGFVESDKNRLRKQQFLAGNVQVKEYGVAAAVETVFAETTSKLKTFFPNDWQRLVCLAYGRLVHQAPLKNMAHLHALSWLSETCPNACLSPASISRFLRDIGRDRAQIVAFCRAFKTAGDNILFDGTDLVSQSECMDLPRFSKGKSGTYDNMINLMLLFSVRLQDPLYYRNLPGNIKDVSAFKLSLEESGIRDATVVIDKGFASAFVML